MLLNGEVKYLGPHHFFISSGEVHAFHTFSRYESKMRVMVNAFLFCVSVAMLSYLLVTHTGFSGASQEHYAFAGLFFTFPIPISLQVRQGISTSPDIRIWKDTTKAALLSKVMGPHSPFL
jgi:hypothetical protein